MTEKFPVKELYRLDDLPIFQNRMYDSAQEARACPRGNMVLVENQETGMIFNTAFQPEKVVYDNCYQNEQGVSPLFQNHLNSIAGIIERGMGRQRLVEVGCGKGFFLEMLLEKGFDLTGFDPTYEGENPRVKRHFFQPGVGIKADGIILRHVTCSR